MERVQQAIVGFHGDLVLDPMRTLILFGIKALNLEHDSFHSPSRVEFAASPTVRPAASLAMSAGRTDDVLDAPHSTLRRSRFGRCGQSSCGLTGNQPRTALIRHIRPCPLK